MRSRNWMPRSARRWLMSWREQARRTPRHILKQRPEIADYRVDYHPAWLPEQMPNNAGRIQFEIAK